MLLKMIYNPLVPVGPPYTQSGRISSARHIRACVAGGHTPARAASSVLAERVVCTHTSTEGIYSGKAHNRQNVLYHR